MEDIYNVERDLILSGIRLDGRDPTQSRKLKTQQLAPGKYEVALGNSLVLACVSASMATPYTDRPHEGFLEMHCNFLPMAHKNFESLLGFGCKTFGNDVSREITRLLEKTIAKAKAINTESLCIKIGEAVWRVRLDLHILHHDGNLIDLCMIAAML